MHTPEEREFLKHEHHQMMLRKRVEAERASASPQPGDRFRAGLYRPRRVGFPTVVRHSQGDFFD